MRESKGEVTEAGPSIAVQMVGLNGVPVAGDEFSVCSTEQEVLPLSWLLHSSYQSFLKLHRPHTYVAA